MEFIEFPLFVHGKLSKAFLFLYYLFSSGKEYIYIFNKDKWKHLNLIYIILDYYITWYRVFNFRFIHELFQIIIISIVININIINLCRAACK